VGARSDLDIQGKKEDFSTFKESILDVAASFNGGYWKFELFELLLRHFNDTFSSAQAMKPNAGRVTMLEQIGRNPANTFLRYYADILWSD
jgi:hypothetical protein